jgi:hypothetical protein
MSARPTDLQLRQALVAHAPVAAPADLRERILVAAEATRQEQRLPSLIAPFFEADLIARRRNLVIAAALLIALTLAGAAAVGSWLEERRIQLLLAPPADMSRFVEDTYLRMADLPAFEMVVLEAGDRHDIRSNGDGVIRDQQASVGVSRIVSRERVVQLITGDPSGALTWIEEGRSPVVPGLEIARSMGLSTECNVTWTYVGLRYVLGRPTHGAMCDQRLYRIDAETGLVLLTEAVPAALDPGRGPSADPGSSPSVDPNATDPPVPSPYDGPAWQVLQLRLGQQPPELFGFVPPSGYRMLRADDPACANAWMAACAEPLPSGEPPRPFVTPPPVASAEPATPDADDLAAAVDATYRNLPALEIKTDAYDRIAGDPNIRGRVGEIWHWSDGAGAIRTEFRDDLLTVVISTPDHFWYSHNARDGTATGSNAERRDSYSIGGQALGFHSQCPTGWEHAGLDLVLGRPAHHLVCGRESFWVDAEWLLVLRSERLPTDPLELTSSISEVVEIRFVQPPAELFQIPADAFSSGSGG